MVNQSEVMRHNSSLDFVEERFQAGKTSCRNPMWRDWPDIDFLFTINQGWNLGSSKNEILGPYDYEDCFLEDMWQRTRGSCVSKVLETEKGQVVGYATLTFRRNSEGDFWLTDFSIHLAAVSHVETLLHAFCWSKGKTKCYVDEESPEKCDVLRALGFEQKAVLRKQVKGKAIRVVLMQLDKGFG